MADKKEPAEDKSKKEAEELKKEKVDEPESEPEESMTKDIVEEEKEAEAEGKEQDYNSIFDDDYVEDEGEEKGEEAEDEAEEDELETEEEAEIEQEEAAKEKDAGKTKDSSSEKKEKKEKDKPKPEKKENDEEVEKKEEKGNENEIALESRRKKGSSKKKILIALAVVLALLLGALGGYLYFKNANKPKEEVKQEESKAEEPKEETVEKDVYVKAEGGLNMRKEPEASSEVVAVIPNGTKLSVLEEKGSWYKVEYKGEEGWISKEYTSDENPLVYENTTYGFQLTFPDSWSSYKVIEKDVDNGDGTTSKVLYVGIKTADANTESTVGKGYVDMFAISALTPQQWATIDAGEGPKPAYLGQNSKYVFAWSPSQAGTDDTKDERELMTSILKTFKIL